MDSSLLKSIYTSHSILTACQHGVCEQEQVIVYWKPEGTLFTGSPEVTMGILCKESTDERSVRSRRTKRQGGTGGDTELQLCRMPASPRFLESWE